MARRFPPARPRPPQRPTKKAKPSTVPPHDFEEDPSVAGDHRNRRWCRRCGLPGEPGDDRHPLGSLPMPSLLPPVAPEVREEEARRLGERPEPDDQAA